MKLRVSWTEHWPSCRPSHHSDCTYVMSSVGEPHQTVRSWEPEDTEGTPHAVSRGDLVQCAVT